MRALTIVLPYFCNQGMLAEQAAIWQALPSDLRVRLHVVVVDDCSPKGQRATLKGVTVAGLGSMRVYRLLQKKRWNWLSARNLGAKVATTEWVLLTDIDHVIPEDTIARLVTGPLDPSDVYRFKRVTVEHPWPYEVAALPVYKSHNDTWLLTKALFFDDRVGGYDERLSGCYGTSGEFRDRLVRAARGSVVLNEVIIRYPREVIPDASTPPSVYTRKNDPKNDAELSKRKAARAEIPGWKPLHGLVPYEEVYDSSSQAVA